MKILLVEDSMTQLRLLEKILKGDFELCFAEDAFDAYLQLHKNDDISVVMVNYNMPFANGAEFIRKIKQVEKFEDIPVILFTEDNSSEAYIDILESGATSFLKKPFSGNNLKKILANYIKEESYV